MFTCGHSTETIILFNNRSTGKMKLICENSKLSRCVILGIWLAFWRRWLRIWFVLFCSVIRKNSFLHSRENVHLNIGKRDMVPFNIVEKKNYISCKYASQLKMGMYLKIYCIQKCTSWFLFSWSKFFLKQNWKIRIYINAYCGLLQYNCKKGK